MLPLLVDKLTILVSRYIHFAILTCNTSHIKYYHSLVYNKLAYVQPNTICYVKCSGTSPSGSTPASTTLSFANGCSRVCCSIEKRDQGQSCLSTSLAMLQSSHWYVLLLSLCDDPWRSVEALRSQTFQWGLKYVASRSASFFLRSWTHLLCV